MAAQYEIYAVDAWDDEAGEPAGGAALLCTADTPREAQRKAAAYAGYVADRWPGWTVVCLDDFRRRLRFDAWEADGSADWPPANERVDLTAVPAARGAVVA